MEGFKLLNSNHWAFDVHYERNKTHSLPKGNLILGKRGLHFCKQPHLLLLFKRYQPDLLFCKVKATGAIEERDGIFATTQLTIVEEHPIDVLWQRHSLEIKDFFNQCDDLQKEQLLNYICQWDADFVKSLPSPKLQYWSSLCRGDVNNLPSDEQSLKRITSLSYFCYSKRHSPIVEKYWSIMIFNDWIAHWEFDFVDWFLRDQERMKKVSDVVKTSSFVIELMQMDVENLKVWSKFFPSLVPHIYSILKSNKVKITDHRVIFWLHNNFSTDEMNLIPTRNFGTFSFAHSMIVSILQRYRQLNPSLSDIYEFYQKGHLYYFEFFIESSLIQQK